MKRIALGLLAATALTYSAHAEPAIVYDLGGKFDKSFNEAAFMGAEKFKEETGEGYREFEIQNDAQREQALRDLEAEIKEVQASLEQNRRNKDLIVRKRLEELLGERR